MAKEKRRAEMVSDGAGRTRVIHANTHTTLLRGHNIHTAGVRLAQVGPPWYHEYSSNKTAALVIGRCRGAFARPELVAAAMGGWRACS